MIKEARGTGATLEEARENAIVALNAGDNADIQFEIISTPKKKILGLFGGSVAEVRVFIELPDEKPKKPRSNKNTKKNDNRVKNDNPAAEKAAKPEKTEGAAKAEKPAKVDKPTKPEKVEKTEKVACSVEDDYKDAVDASTLSADSSAGRAVAYLTDILTKLGCTDITARVAERENGAFIILDGEGLGVVIGHRGETLDALQYLAGLAANNGGGYYKVSLNIGNYREKREQTLITLATRVSEQVLRTGRNRALEPMNPYERRIIHTAVQNIEGVTSGSVGEGSGRRVVIAVEGSEIRAPRNDRSRSDRGRGRSGRGRGDRNRSSNTVATAPAREPKKDSDIPLYGKIN